MLQTVFRSIIKYQVVIHQIKQDIRQFILLDGNIGSNPATVTHLTSGSSVEYGSQAIRNTPHTAVLITVFIVDSLHTTPARNIVFGSRQLHCTSIRQRTSGLHKPFSERTVTHHHCTVVILQCACQDFRRGRRSAIHQHSQRDFQIQRLAQRLVRIACLLGLSFRRHQRFAARQKEVGYFHSFVQQAAAVITQVDNQRSYSLFFQIEKCLFELFGRITGESAQIDITDIVIQHCIIRNKRQLDRTANNIEFQRLLRSGALYLQFETCTYLPAKHFAYFLIILSRKVFTVYFQKNITGFQTHGSRRHIFIRLGYHGTFQLGIPSYDRADTAIRILQHLFQFALVVFRKILRIRVE